MSDSHSAKVHIIPFFPHHLKNLLGISQENNKGKPCKPALIKYFKILPCLFSLAPH